MSDIADTYLGMLEQTGMANNALMEFIETSGFLTAPAASTPAYHGCYEGGLADHSVAVAQRIAQKGGDTLDVFCALVHDLCKAKLYVKLETPQKKYGKTFLYSTDEAVAAGGHARLTLAILDECGIALPPDARQAVEWHMGKWTDDAPDAKHYGRANQKYLRSLIKNNERLRRMCEADMFASHVLGR